MRKNYYACIPYVMNVTLPGAIDAINVLAIS
jgi:hypothetical protein